MQQYGNNQILTSPSDLVTFLGCPHASFLGVKALSENMDKAEAANTGQLLKKKGLEHEAPYLQKLKDEGKFVIEIREDRNLQDRTQLTLEALQSGADVIYQAVLFAGPWRGDADFLIKCGKKIGVTSNSYKAVHNLLEKVESVAVEKGLNFHGIKKASSGNDETIFYGQFIRSETKTDNMSLGADLFAGTAWTFVSPHFDGQPDYLFIDEAGQVATANVVAMATATKNIILVADQMQLGQPIQGTHPDKAGLSVLGFLLDDHSTIPAERGIFLGQTRRMRPSICQFISDVFYDGRLTAHKTTAERSLNLQGIDLPNEGIVMIPAEDKGCSRKSIEEGEIIKAKYQALPGQEFTDRDGSTRPITEDDILVVTSYNAQVNYLRAILPDNAKVGAVDKFQGQEAPIVLISMVASSVEDLPRNIEFLYSKNRLNVAVSRAQCLAVVVANPKLLEIPCGTVEQMKPVSTFCWLDECASYTLREAI